MREVEWCWRESRCREHSDLLPGMVEEALLTLNADCTVLISKIRCRGCIILFQRKVYYYRH